MEMKRKEGGVDFMHLTDATKKPLCLCTFFLSLAATSYSDENIDSIFKIVTKPPALHIVVSPFTLWGRILTCPC